MFATADRLPILPYVGSSFANSVASVLGETTGWSSIYHQSGLNVTVGGVAPVTTSR